VIPLTVLAVAPPLAMLAVAPTVLAVSPPLTAMAVAPLMVLQLWLGVPTF